MVELKKDLPEIFEEFADQRRNSFLAIKKLKEQGVPVALALSQRVLNGRGAWRLQGGGFAGTIQAFVPVDLLDAYKAAIDGCFGEGSCRTRRTVLLFLKKWRLQMEMLMMGDTAVASAAPASPRPIVNMKI